MVTMIHQRYPEAERNNHNYVFADETDPDEDSDEGRWAKIKQNLRELLPPSARRTPTHAWEYFYRRRFGNNKIINQILKTIRAQYTF